MRTDDESVVWRTASWCETNACVAVGRVGGEVLIRDLKDPHGPVLRFSFPAWGAFIEAVRANEFDA